MKIGLLGTGDVGRRLATGLIGIGHEVRMGSREANNEKAQSWAAKNGPNASVGTFADAAGFGELIVLATRGVANTGVIDLAGPQRFAGKVVIDATNPLVFRENAPPELAVGYTDSAGEQVQRRLPNARVVKAFNIVGNAHFIKPDFPGGPPDMFICGNDEAAKKTVAEICTKFGWPVTDIGGIEGARLLEPLCILWVTCGIRSGSWNNAFKLLRK